MTKDQYLKKLEEAHKRLLEALEKLPDEKEVFEGWTKKEVMSHIAGWYEEGISGTPKILKGEKPDSFRMTINGYNKKSVTKRKSLSLEVVKKNMVSLHKQWLEQIKKLSEEQITSYYGTMLGKKKINVAWMIEEGISHDNAHAKELENI